jgi:uncharacterized protein
MNDVTFPRYSTFPFPPYTYVPGTGTPHPVSDPRGHMHGVAEELPAPLDPQHWQQCETFLYAVDLFNHGYFWEAHEAWESLWHAAGHRGVMGDFLKALIKLAAAGVKQLEGNPSGKQRHLQRAHELLEQVLKNADTTNYCGIHLMNLSKSAIESANSQQYSLHLVLGDSGNLA